jgi:PAS domain S-box-containing protein
MVIVAILSLASAGVLIRKGIIRKEYTLIGSATTRIFLGVLYIVALVRNDEMLHSQLDYYQTLGVCLILFGDVVANVVYLIGAKYRKSLNEMQLMEALGKLETKYHTMVECAPVGVYSFDAKTGIINYINPVVCSMLGYERKELLGRYVYDLVMPEQRDMVKTNVSLRLAAQIETIKYNVNLLHKNGTYVELSVAGRIVYNGKANILGYAVLAK